VPPWFARSRDTDPPHRDPRRAGRRREDDHRPPEPNSARTAPRRAWVTSRTGATVPRRQPGTALLRGCAMGESVGLAWDAQPFARRSYRCWPLPSPSPAYRPRPGPSATSTGAPDDWRGHRQLRQPGHVEADQRARKRSRSSPDVLHRCGLDPRQPRLHRCERVGGHGTQRPWPRHRPPDGHVRRAERAGRRRKGRHRAPARPGRQPSFGHRHCPPGRPPLPATSPLPTGWTPAA
jgi:hypothetical protein